MTLCRFLCFFAYDVIHHIMFVALAYEVFRHTMLVAYYVCRILGIFSVSLVTFVAVPYIFFSHHIDIFFSHHIDICLKAIMEIFALAIMEPESSQRYLPQPSWRYLPQPQCCGSGSVLDPYSGAAWIRILFRIRIRIHTC